MRALIAALLLLPGAASAKEKGKSAPKEKPPEASYALPLLPPTTGPITVPLVLARLEELEQNLSSLTARFHQSVSVEETGSRQSIDGTVEYLKPERLRVEHLRPERQTVVTDGRALWVWRRESNQVIQSSLAAWKQSEPALGLMDFGGYSAMLKRYHVSVASVSAPNPDGHRTAVLALKPKERDGSFELRLTFSTRNFFPAAAELSAGQVRVSSTFDEVRLNPPIPDERFRFTPPKGADILPDFRPPELSR